MVELFLVLVRVINFQPETEGMILMLVILILELSEQVLPRWCSLLSELVFKGRRRINSGNEIAGGKTPFIFLL